MSRDNSVARKCFKRMCREKRINEDSTYRRMKFFLETYRESYWDVQKKPEVIEYGDGEFCLIHPGILRALDYLEHFDPEREEGEFEKKIKPLFETRWISEMVDDTLEKVREFPHYGETYHTILSKSYISNEKHTEDDIMEELKISRSPYYDRKKDAVMTFAVAFWNTAVPKIRGIAGHEEYEEPDNSTIIKEFQLSGVWV